ncbi:MAG: type III pantothenate kinase [Cyclobacteriaceae bacterium]|jgi:type III pantothenate kinase|nr:type III pantothenate kinase [Cyclobacteriaceae bacterium]
MISLAIDWGNTRIKMGWFRQGMLIRKETAASVAEAVAHTLQHTATHVIISSVNEEAEALLQEISVPGEKLVLSPALSLPITLDYETPQTLGVDRLAAACGAIHLFPHTPCLIVDAGTCITYDYVDDQHVFRGGSIAPGLAMRLKAMHTFTARLPLVEIAGTAPLLGKSTQAAMQSGALRGMTAEINGMIEQHRNQTANLHVLLTGGDAQLFENQVKPPIFAAPDLVLLGLNRILTHHVGF